MRLAAFSLVCLSDSRDYRAGGVISYELLSANLIESLQHYTKVARVITDSGIEMLHASRSYSKQLT